MQKKTIYVIFILLMFIFIVYPIENTNSMIVKHNIYNSSFSGDSIVMLMMFYQ